MRTHNGTTTHGASAKRAYRKPRTVSCHKCEWNGRTDEEANRACVECSLAHIRKELANVPNLDFPTDGQSLVHSDSAESGDELKHAQADDLALHAMRGPSPAATAFPPEVEEALFRLVRDVQDMGEATLRALYWLLKGYDITRTAAMLGVTKQAVSKNLAYFFQAHPNWRELMPKHHDPTTWRRKLHGVW